MKRSYFLKRLLFIPITLFGILLINFLFIQLAPGGPVEQILARHQSPNTLSRLSGEQVEIMTASDSAYRGSHGLTESLRAELNHQFGFDKPLYVRFFKMLKDYATFNFGKSFYQDKSVISLILEKMPVSLSLGFFSTLLIYFISIPLGIKKAVSNGTSFDKNSSLILTVCYAVPAFLLAIFFIIMFAGGRYLQIFPLKGLVSDNWDELNWFLKIADYLWHIALPVLSLTLGGLAALSFLTKNAFLEELNKPYVRTAIAKGLSQRQVLYGHIFRNALLIVIAGFPAMLIGMLFTGSVLIEVIFSLDGLGLLGYEAVMNRDYPVIFGTLYIFALLGLILNLLSDYIYTRVDPRIHFEKSP